MNQPETFTGRRKRSTTRATVVLSDTIARMVITLGGLGTIAAVLLVGVFLLVVALPLFRPASIDLKQTIPFTLAEKKLLASGLDDSGSLAWFCNTDQISVIELQSGKELLSRSTKDCGLEQASAICCLPNKLHAAVGFQGGEIRTGRLGLETFFVPKSDIPKPAKKLQVGEAVTVGDAVYLQASNEITKRIELVTDLSEHVSTSLKNSIIRSGGLLLSNKNFSSGIITLY